MSLSKNIRSIESQWAECFETCSVEAIARFCQSAKDPTSEKFLFSSKFQKEFLPFLSESLGNKSHDLLENIDPLMWVLGCLVDRKKFKLKKCYSELLENLMVFLGYVACNQDSIIKESEKLGKVLQISQKITNLHYFSSEHEEMIEKKVGEILKEVGKNGCYKSYILVLEEDEVDTVIGILKILLSTAKKSKRDWNESQLIESFSVFLSSVREELKSSLSINLAYEKVLLVIQIITEVTERQKRFSISFISQIEDKLKILIFEYFQSFNSADFSFSSIKTDKNYLALLYYQKLNLFLSTTLCNEFSPSIWNIPLIIFHMVIGSEADKSSTGKMEMIYFYSLEFILSFYCSSTIVKQHISDYSISTFLFCKEIFCSQSSKVKEAWHLILNNIFDLETGSKALFDSIYSSLKENLHLLSYLQNFGFWVQSIINTNINNRILAYLIKNEILNHLIIFLDENSEEIVQIEIVSIIQMITQQRVIEIPYIEKSFKLFFSIVLEKKPENGKNYEQIIANFLNCQQVEIFECYLSHFSEIKDPAIILCLLESFQRSLLNKNFEEFMFANQLQSKSFEAFSRVSPGSDVNMWKSLLLVLIKITSHRFLTFTDEPVFSFMPIVDKIRSHCSPESLLDDLHEIVMSSLIDIESGIIRFPQLIPLFGEILCKNSKLLVKHHREVLKKIRFSQICTDLLANHHFFSVIFFNLLNKENYETWSNYETLCLQLISTNFSVYDLINWINAFKSVSDLSLKAKLLEILRTGISKFDTSDQVTKYVYFTRENKVFADYSNENLTMPKEYAVVVWVFPETTEKSSLISFKTSHTICEIFIHNYSVILKLNDTEHECSNVLKKFDWNLICVNFGTKLSIYLNDSFAHFIERKNYRIPKVNKLLKLCIGNNVAFSYEKLGFVGKMSSIFIMNKCMEIDFIKEMHKISAKISNIYGKSLKIFCKDLKEFIFLDVLEEEVFKKNNLAGVYKFNNIPAHTGLRVYGIRRFLLEIFKLIKDIETLNEFFKLIKMLVYKNQQKSDVNYFSKSSFKFVIHLMTKCPYSEELCCTIENILEICSRFYLKILQQAILTNPKLKIILQKNKKFYRVFINKYMENNYPIRENLLVFCSLMKDAGSQDFVEDLKSYLRPHNEQEILNSIPSVIYFYQIEQDLETVKMLITVLQDLRLNVNTSKQLSAAILNMTGLHYVSGFQILAIETLLFSHKLDLDTETVQKYLDYLDKNLPLEISNELVLYFLTIAFDPLSSLKDQKFYFLDMVLKRFKHFKDPVIRKNFFGLFRSNKKNLFEGVIKRDYFPGFIIDDIQSSGSGESIEFAELLLDIASKNSGFRQIQSFFNSHKDVELFRKLVKNSIDSSNNNEVLPSFEVLQEALWARPGVLVSIYDILENSIANSYARASLDNFSVSKLYKNDLVKEMSENKEFIVNYSNFLLFGLFFFRSRGEAFPYFFRFLESDEIRCFNNAELTENPFLAVSETFISVYILIELLKKYLEGCEFIKEDLISFITKANIPEKLEKFCEKNVKIIENSLRDILCTESIAEINRENIESQVQVKLRSFIDSQEKLAGLINCYDLLNSQLFTDTKILNEIIKVFNHIFSKITVSGLCLEKQPGFKSKLDSEPAEKWLNELKDFSWVQQMQEDMQRDYLKIAQDYRYLKKSLKKLNTVLEKPLCRDWKIRQVYDRFYRWSSFKPVLPKKPKKNKEINSKKDEKNFNEIKEFCYLTECSSDSPSISDNSALPSRENTANYDSNSVFAFTERIKVQGSYFGKLKINQLYFELTFDGLKKSPELKGALKFTAGEITKTRIWYSWEFLEVVPKRFMHSHSALEFILKTGKSYYLNFFSKSKREEVLKATKKWDLKSHDQSLKKKIDSLRHCWKKGLICNFEYLMNLNKISSRSLNDLSQYPIFPWILSKYNTEKFEYDNPGLFRNFKYPVGAQNSEYQLKLQEKYEEWKDDLIEAYHHGSHYSNCGIVLHYLVRIEPFATQARDLQGGSYDVADRLFLSMQKAWESCSENFGSDCKELVPELFFNSFVFDSQNENLLGVTSLGMQVVHVQPPLWASNNWDFIIKHRNLLESALVSKELCNWIDLIFGFKQTGKNAQNSFNVFCAASYEEKFEDFCLRHGAGETDCMLEQVYHFGQTPELLFESKPHILREDIGKTMQIFKFFYCDEGKEMGFKCVDKIMNVGNKVFSMFLTDDCVVLIKSVKGIFSISRYPIKDSFELGSPSEFTMQGYIPIREKYLSYISSTFTYSTYKIDYTNDSFCFWNNKIIVAGLDISNNLKIFDLKGKLLQSLVFHSQCVLSVAHSSEFIFSGSFDSSIKGWKLSNEYCYKFLSFYGHKAPVTKLRVIDSFDILLSYSLDKLILIHDTKNSECLYSIKFDVVLISAHEYGFFAVYDSEKIVIYGINGDVVSKYYVKKVSCLSFSVCGNFMVEGSDCGVLLRDFFKQEEKRLEKIGNAVPRDVFVFSSEKAVFALSRGEQEYFVSVYRLISVKKVEAQNEIFDILG